MAGIPCFAVTDTETGGLNEKIHALTQVSIIIVDDELNELETFAHRVIPKPGFLVDPKAAEINGYDEAEWLRTGLTWDAAERAYAQFLEQWFPDKACVGVAHNASFDTKFIRAHMPSAFAKYLYIDEPDVASSATHYGWYCTMKALRIWRAKTKIAGKAKLQDLADLAQYTREGAAHDALQDTRTCLAGFKWLQEHKD
jgi:DNA polymerase III epsilon subunit-like protein